jgi:hypothetical protein
MAEHGGYRAPASPAPVSGPGKYSKRTDGHPSQVLSAAPDQAYGEQKAQLDAQRLAPMGAAAPLPPSATPASAPADAGPSLAPYAGGDFTGPSARPGEPITHGVDIGDGGGSAVLNLPAGPRPDGYLTNMLEQMSATDTTGTLGKLYLIAKQRGV